MFIGQMSYKFIYLATAAAFLVAGCNPSTYNTGTGGLSAAGAPDLLERYNELVTINSAEFTPNSTVETMTGTASFSGVGNFSNGSSVFNAYLGAIDIDIAFASGDVSGTIGDFAEYNISSTGYVLGSDTPGSMTVSGSLGTNNESLTDGFSGRAIGTLNGVSLAGDIDGNLLGTEGDAMVIYFDDDEIFGAMGVGFAAR